MARPQIEDGHTRIANEIMENLMKMYLLPSQWQVLLCIIRKTYGFQKETALGNIFEQSFEEIWNGDRYNHLRQMLRLGEVPPPCTRCPIYRGEQNGV